MDDIAKSFDILGLAYGASEEQIKQAYRDLVKVWHPDRFPGDIRLQQRAEERLKEINRAYELLMNIGATSSAGPKHSTPTSRPSPPEPPKPPERPQPVQKPHQVNKEINLSRSTPFLVWLTVGAVVIAALGIINNQHNTEKQPMETSRTNVARNATPIQPKEPESKVTDRLKSKSNDVSEIRIQKSTEERQSNQVIPENKQTVSNSTDNGENAIQKTQVDGSSTSAKTTQPSITLGYFTVGSTKDEVLAVQGSPDSFTNTVWKYGPSEIYFGQDRVTSALSKRLNIKMECRSNQATLTLACSFKIRSSLL
jgi:hypothetical protein